MAGKKIGEVVRLVVNPIWNAYSFFTLYANTDGVRGKLRTDRPATSANKAASSSASACAHRVAVAVRGNQQRGDASGAASRSAMNLGAAYLRLSTDPVASMIDVNPSEVSTTTSSNPLGSGDTVYCTDPPLI